MGVSTDAILFYGYHLGEEETEVPEQAAEVYGPDEPVLVGHHCSAAYTMHYLYVQASQTRASRGYPKEITDLGYQTGWDLRLTEFAKRFGLPLPSQDGASKPGWWLVSWWG
jgi:hypothetical protein